MQAEHRITAPKVIPIRIGGFSMLEVLTVMAITLMLTSLSLASASEMRARGALDDNEATIIRAFESARTRSFSGVGTGSHGVHLTSGAVVLFSGTTYNPTDPTNHTYLLSPSVSLLSSTSTIIFERITGIPRATSTITLLHTSGKTRVTNIKETGSINKTP